MQEFHWKEAPTKENFLKYNFNLNEGPISIEWMKDAKLNICYNALDRQLEKKGSQVRFFGCHSFGMDLKLLLFMTHISILSSVQTLYNNRAD